MSADTSPSKIDFKELFDNFADAVEQASPEDLLAEAEAAGQDTQQIAADVKNTLLDAVRSFEDRKLHAAATTHRTSSTERRVRPFVIPTNPVEKLRILTDAPIRDQRVARITASFRDLTKLSDDDTRPGLEVPMELAAFQDVAGGLRHKRLFQSVEKLEKSENTNSDDLLKAISIYKTLIAESSPEGNPSVWVTAKVRMAAALVSLGELELEVGRFAQGRERLEAAGAAYGEALDVLDPVNDRAHWAWVKSALGNALRKLGEFQSRPETLERAAHACREALGAVTRESAPHLWSTTKWRLGNALEALAEREVGTRRVHEAIEAYESALHLSSRDHDPLSWAALQNDLGSALAVLGERETRTVALQKSVQAYYQALLEYTRDKVPFKWAMVKHNLGATLWALGTRQESDRNIEKAVLAYREALKERTQEKRPLEWAMTQHNLGVALSHLGRSQHNEEYLREACAGFNRALVVMTLEGNPLGWVQLNHSLANALATFGELSNDGAAIERALAICRNVLTEITHGNAPRQWSYAQNSLANCLRLLGREDATKERLHDAVRICRDLLMARTPEEEPLGRAATLINLSTALCELSKAESNGDLLQEAWTNLEAAGKALRDKGRWLDFERWPARCLLTPEQLWEYGRVAERNDREKIRAWMFDVTLSVLRHFLGGNWVKKHLYTAGPLKPPPFNVDPSAQFRIGKEGYSLAEMLFNLQHEEGFEGVRERLIEGNIEAVISELEAARFLKMHGEKFRFVKPSGQRGSDYDLEVITPACTICCEVKAKLGAGVTVEGLYNSLKQARSQLPQDAAGLIFVRAGGSANNNEWHSIREAFESASKRLFRQTSRILGTILLTQKHYYEPGGYSGSALLFKVVPSDPSRFGMTSLSDAEIARNWLCLSTHLGYFDSGKPGDSRNAEP